MKKDIEERVINIIAMFRYVCLRWRSILVWAVILAILAGGLSYVKNANAIETESAHAANISLEELEAGLEPESKGKVNAYIDYLEMYDKQLKYNQLAPRMQLDSNGYYRSVLSYYVDNHYTVEYPLVDKVNNINAILEAYTAQVNGLDFVDKFKGSLDVNEELYPYIQELIECKIEKNTSVALIGASGAGKSTFMRMLTGVLKPDSGSILVDGISPAIILQNKQSDINLTSDLGFNKLGYSMDSFINL